MNFKDFTTRQLASPLEHQIESPTLPYPIENVEEDIANAYEIISRILFRVEVAQKNPVVKNSPIVKKQIKNLQYKLKTCKKLVKECSKSVG